MPIADNSQNWQPLRDWMEASEISWDDPGWKLQESRRREKLLFEQYGIDRGFPETYQGNLPIHELVLELGVFIPGLKTAQ